MYLYVFIVLFSVFTTVKGYENINFIFDFSYVERNIEKYKDFDEHSEILMNRNKGFNLNYGELNFSLPVDSKIKIKAVFHITQDSFEVGELFFLTGRNLKFKCGKFRSSVGILNDKHQHEWDFSEIPLFYQSFFGDHALNEKGVQISYRSKDIFTGFEILQGENEYSFGEEGADLLTIFMRGDFPYIKPVFSYLEGGSKEGNFSQETKMSILGGEFLLSDKVRFQGEYAYRLKGSSKNSGYYIQTTYSVKNFLKTGIRYGYVENNLYRYSGMITYFFSEKVKLRIQYNYDRSLILNGKRENVNEFIIEITLETGSDEH